MKEVKGHQWTRYTAYSDNTGLSGESQVKEAAVMVIASSSPVFHDIVR